MFSDGVVFGQVLCVLKHVFSRFWYTFVRGVPPEAYQGCHSEAQWCHMVPRCAFSSIFHRFWGPFWEAIFEHVASFQASSFRVFFSRRRDALVMIWASFGEPFWKHFRRVFRNRWNLDFDDPSYAKAMIWGYWAHPFLYFSIVFFTLRFWIVFFSVSDRFGVPWRLPLGACGVTLHPFFRYWF